MDLIHETYASQELINQLVEIGFDWREFLVSHSLNDPFRWEIPFNIAQKWLRDEKQISVEASSVRFYNRNQDNKFSMRWKYEIHPTRLDVSYDEFVELFERFKSDDTEYETYEQALEAGIKHCVLTILNQTEQ
jgi:hypothetical protein